MMKNTQQVIIGGDSIGKLDLLYKLKIETIPQNMAIISFGKNIPRFFSTATTHKVIKEA